MAIGAILLTLVDIWLGLVFPLPGAMRALESGPLIALTTIASVTLFLGPGLALIHLGLIGRRWGLGLAIVPGILLTAAIGLLAWVLAGHVHPHRTVAVATTLVAVALLVTAAAPGRRRGLDGADWAALALILLVLLFGVARGTYSLGPAGDLYGGTISQTLEASNRSDSRISYLIPELVANGRPPYGSNAVYQLFRPFRFSSRGPISGLAASPIVLNAGAHPQVGFPESPWEPFDQQGFAAYRVAMEVMAALALLTAYSLARMLAGSRTALFALLLVATTPFVVHDVYFTWPKLLAAALVLLSAQAVLGRRPLLAGVFVGIGYLVHPLALTLLPGLLLLWLVVAYRNRAWRRKVVWSGAGVLATLCVAVAFYVGWQLVNGRHAAQSHEFLPTIIGAGRQQPAKSLASWASFRADSLLSTLVPLYVLIVHYHDPQFGPVIPPGQPIVLFFEQYWTSLPFAVGILFSPLYVYGLVRAFRRDWMVVTATVIVPFVAFLIYWGDADTGLMREGLHAWFLGTLVIYALTRRSGRHWPVVLERVLLVTRVIEMLLLALLPTVWTSGKLYDPAFRSTDVVSLAFMILSAAGLVAAVFLVTLPRGQRRRGELAASGGAKDPAPAAGERRLPPLEVPGG